MENCRFCYDAARGSSGVELFPCIAETAV